MADRAVERPAARLRAPAPPRDLIDALRAHRLAIGIAAAVAAVVLVQLPVLGGYFFNDDAVPLADIASRGTGAYIKDLFLMDDLTPNWRFLTGLVYLAEYRAFGLDALPYLLVNVALHGATAALLCWLLWRALGAVWPAALGGALFGVTAAHVPTVGQVTALNNVLAAFLLVSSVVVLYEGPGRRSAAPWTAGAALLFAGAVAANESSAVSAPVLALVTVWRLAPGRDARAWARVALVAAPFAVLSIAAVAGFASCGCTEAELYERDEVLSNLWLYFGRLLYPVGLEAPGHAGAAHLAAGPVLLALALLALARGPALGRIAAAWLVLAVVPYLPLGLWSASRYVYLAAAPFALLAAVYAHELARASQRLAPAAPVLLAFLALSGVALVAWQGFEQNQAFAARTDPWRDLVAALERSDIDPAPGSTVYLRGGPVTEPLAQCTVLPAFGELLWGGGVRLFAYDPPALASYRVRPGYDVAVFDYERGRFVPAPGPSADPGAVLLPHVSPDATGNLCRRELLLPQ